MGYIANKSTWIIKKTFTWNAVEYLATGKLVWNGGTAGTAADWDYVAPAPLAIPDGYVERGMLAESLDTLIPIKTANDAEYVFEWLDNSNKTGMRLGVDGRLHARFAITSNNGRLTLAYDGVGTQINLEDPLPNVPEAFIERTMLDADLSSTVPQALDLAGIGETALYVWTDSQNKIAMKIQQDGRVAGRFLIESLSDKIVVTYDGLSTKIDFDETGIRIGDIEVIEGDAYINGTSVTFAHVDANNRVAFAILADGTFYDPSAAPAPELPEVILPKASVYVPLRDAYHQSECERSIVVLGDSISTWTLWPTGISEAREFPVVSDSRGGTATPEFLSRQQVHELVPPVVGQPLKTRLFRQGRSKSTSRTTEWLSLGLCLDEIEAAEFYLDGVLADVVFEKQRFPATTDYATNQNRIYVSGHPWAVHDVVYFETSFIPSQTIDRESVAADRIGPNTFDGFQYYTINGLPPRIVYRHPYVVTAADAGWIEVKETTAGPTINIGGNATAQFWAVGGFVGPTYSSGTATIRTRCQRNTWTTLVAGGTNDGGAAANTIIQNIDKMIDNMAVANKRFIVISPFSGAYVSRGPDSADHLGYLALYQRMSRRYGRHFCNVWQTLLDSRPASELALMTDPDVPELVRLIGTQDNPIVAERWSGFPSLPPEETLGDSTRWQWIGKTYLPIIHRPTLNDLIHPDFNRTDTRAIITNAILAKINELEY